MYMYLYVYIYMHVYVYMYINAHVYMCVYVRVCVYLRVNTNIFNTCICLIYTCTLSISISKREASNNLAT